MTAELADLATALGVPPWLLLVVVSGVVGAGIVLVGNYLLLGWINPGNPRALAEMAKIYWGVRSLPPTTLFRWRVGAGLRVFVYDADADEEKDLSAPFRLNPYAPTLRFWMWGDRPRSAAFVAQRARYDLLFRFYVCFLWMFCGSFVAILLMAVTVSWHWFVALVFLAVYQFVTGRIMTKQQIGLANVKSCLVMGAGVFVYLQGGIFETIAACTVGAFFVIVALIAWYAVSSRRMQEYYRLFPCGDDA